MITADFHVHTQFSDGRDAIGAVAARAYASGMTAVGFSEHVYAPYDLEVCMRPGTAPAYREACRRLREEYRGRMAVYCGIEQDLFAEEPTDGYDYVIGAVHYVRINGEYLTVDWKRDTLDRAAALLGGDMLKVAEEYFRLVSRVVEVTRCQLIAHFDLIAKLNQREHLFDENDPRYVAAWRQAADILLETGVPFEINTGAVSRGYRTEAYPALPIRRYLRDRGARFVLSSDSHSLETLRYDFERQERICAEEGFVLTDLAVPEVEHHQ